MADATNLDYIQNSTQIPNWFFQWLPHLSLTQSIVLLAVMRKTYGWSKRKDRITNTQLMAMTGLSERAIIYSRHELFVLGFLTFRRGKTYEMCDPKCPPSIPKTAPKSAFRKQRVEQKPQTTTSETARKSAFEGEKPHESQTQNLPSKPPFQNLITSENIMSQEDEYEKRKERERIAEEEARRKREESIEEGRAQMLEALGPMPKEIPKTKLPKEWERRNRRAM